MGWRGTFRTIAAASRRIERAQERERRRLLLLENQNDKMTALARAKHEVDLHESHIASLLSVHKQCTEPIDWHKVLDTPSPAEPIRSNAREALALQHLNGYSPGLLDRLFDRVEQRRKALEHNVGVARQQDGDQYKFDLAKHAEEMAEWEETRNFSQQVIDGDPQALLEAVRQCDPFSDIKDLGSSVEFAASAGPTIVAEFVANGPTVIPPETKTLLRNGKVSAKKMPAGQYLELYQDYVCGCVLRIGRELFSILPIDRAIVTAIGDGLNTETGHMERHPIVSVLLVKESMAKLNFDRIDCSDSLRNFVRNMEFKKSSGFAPVERISAS